MRVCFEKKFSQSKQFLVFVQKVNCNFIKALLIFKNILLSEHDTQTHHLISQ